MPNDRREFMKVAGATAAVTGAVLAAAPAAAQVATAGQFRGIKALAFDAYGTLFDVFSVTALCEQLFPGKGTQLAQTWRVKQLQYSLMRSLMGRHRDFWGLTEDGLVWASKNLKVELTADKKKQLMEAYLSLAAFPDVKPGLEALRQQGLKLAILSNGEPKMLDAAARSAGIRDLLDEVISVEEVKIFKTSNRVLLARYRTHEGEQCGAGVRLGEQLGWRGSSVGWITDILDPAHGRRGSRGARVPGRYDGQGDHRSSSAVARLGRAHSPASS